MLEITWVGKGLTIHLSKEVHDFCLGLAGMTFRLIGQHLRIYGVVLNVVRPCALDSNPCALCTGKTFHYILNVDAGICFHSETQASSKWQMTSSFSSSHRRFRSGFCHHCIKSPRKPVHYNSVHIFVMQMQSGSKIFQFVFCQAALATWLHQVWLCWFSAENITFTNAKEWEKCKYIQSTWNVNIYAFNNIDCTL